MQVAITLIGNKIKNNAIIIAKLLENSPFIFCEAYIPKIKVGIDNGNTNTLIIPAFFFNPNINDAPSEPIRLKLAVPKSKRPSNGSSNSPSSGKPNQ